MDLHRDDATGGLEDQWWNDSMFDDSLQLSMTTPDNATTCGFLPGALSLCDIGSMYDGGYGSQSEQEQEPEDHLLFQSFTSPPALSPSAASSTPPDFAAETELSNSLSSARRKRSHSQSGDAPAPLRADHKLRRSSQPSSSNSSRRRRSSSSSSSTYSGESDDAPVRSRRTSRKTAAGIQPPLTSRKSAPAKLVSANNNSNIKPEAGEGKPGPAGHSAVEKRYRDKINSQFDQLLSTLPHVQADDHEGRTLSKGSILELAVQTVQGLEQENRALYWQVEQLKDAMRFRRYVEGQPQALTGMLSM